MGSIEEKRKALLGKKLEEMGKMGIKERTAENSPFYDQPVESDPPESEPVEQSNVEIEEVETTTTSIPKSKKRRKLNTREENFAEYQQSFLSPTVFDVKTQFTVNRETVDQLKVILQDLGSRTTLTAYIENILRDHISEYRDLINQVTAKRRRKETIPE